MESEKQDSGGDWDRVERGTRCKHVYMWESVTHRGTWKINMSSKNPFIVKYLCRGYILSLS